MLGAVALAWGLQGGAPEGPSSTWQQAWQERLLIQAAAAGDVVAVARLVQAGVRSYEVMNDALRVAETAPPSHFGDKKNKGRAEVAALLRSQGASVKYYAPRNRAPQRDQVWHERLVACDRRWADGLLGAAAEGHVQEVETRLQLGADVNVTGPPGLTALMIAAQEGHAGVVAALLRGDAAVDTESPKGNTAVDLAANQGHAECVRLLVRAGAKRREDRLSWWKR